MKNKLITLCSLVLALAGVGSIQQATAQGTAFTYQGRLTDGATAANGSYASGLSSWAPSSSQAGG